MTDNETKYHCYRLCRAAGLSERGWHILRHGFGTHAAMFGVNPWKLMLWMGHKRIDETMLPGDNYIPPSTTATRRHVSGGS